MTSAAAPGADAANAVLTFWFDETKPHQWYRRDLDFDQIIRQRFTALHENARAGRLDAWRAGETQSLALIILLDQFSRNIFRDTPEAFAQDGLALDAAKDAIARGFNLRFPEKQQAFFYMPFMHSESLAEQDRCVALFTKHMPRSDNLPFAIEHREIIARFGRFPHRNKVLERRSTPDEVAFLEAGGFNP